MSTVRIEVCDSLTSFADNLEQLCEDWPGVWFRGCDGPFDATPKMFRNVRTEGSLGPQYRELDEPYMVHTISRKLAYFKPEGGKNVLDMLCLAQHLHFPTRLLDWSESLGTAVYFSLPHRQAAPHITCLNPQYLNALQRIAFERKVTSSRLGEVTLDQLKEMATTIGGAYESGDELCEIYLSHGKTRDPSAPDRDDDFDYLPIAFFPNYLNQRLLLQQSAFTLHGSSTRSLEDILSAARQEVLDAILVKVAFTQSFLEDNIQQLRKLCANPIHVFGDEAGLFREILDDLTWTFASRP